MNLNGRPWTEEENEVLRVSYEVETLETIAKRLDRTKEAIYQRAIKLGIAKAKYKTWSRDDDDFLLANWGKLSKVKIAEALGSNFKTVTSKAERLGLPKRSIREPLPLTKDEGNPRQVVKVIRPKRRVESPVYEVLPLEHNPFRIMGL